MKHALIVLAAIAAAPAFAQTASTQSQTTPTPAGAATPARSAAQGAGGHDDGVKALRASCRDEAKSKGLQGSAKREDVSACVVHQRPDLTGREQCRTEGFGKGLRKEELHAFVRECAKTKG